MRRPGLIAFLAAFLALAGQIVFGMLPAQAAPTLDSLGHVHICSTGQPGHAQDAPAQHKGTCAACSLCVASLLQTTLASGISIRPAQRVEAVIRLSPRPIAASPPEQPRAAQPRGPPT